jgi:hypothetical protein
LLVIAQYRFPKSRPPSTCPSIAILVRLAPTGGQWEVKDRLVLDASYHNQLESIRWVNIFGFAYDELAVESDLADKAGDIRSDMHLFDLSVGRFKEILVAPTRMHAAGAADMWTQTLDMQGTAARGGRDVCFQKIAYSLDHRWFATPRVSQECYQSAE